ncbi:MAG TPA: ATP-binding protein, partial [Anaerovoracaceae bacterium]|nr:ATP-binding protein [Anaerovoracaceae bacterium]
FQSIKIQNFKSFRDFEMNFEIVSGKDLHIFTAPNAGGKTNLFDAISWCLFDGDFNANGFSIPNTEAIFESKRKETDNCFVSVKIMAEDSGDILLFERYALFDPKTGKKANDGFNINITKEDGQTLLKDKAELTQVIVEKYFPKSIQPYFFVDSTFLHRPYNGGHDRQEKQKLKSLLYRIESVRNEEQEETRIRIGDRATEIFIEALNWKTWRHHDKKHIKIDSNYSVSVLDEFGHVSEDANAMEEIATVKLAILLALYENLDTQSVICMDSPFVLLTETTREIIKHRFNELSKSMQVVLLLKG